MSLVKIPHPLTSCLDRFVRSNQTDRHLPPRTFYGVKRLETNHGRKVKKRPVVGTDLRSRDKLTTLCPPVSDPQRFKLMFLEPNYRFIKRMTSSKNCFLESPRSLTRTELVRSDERMEVGSVRLSVRGRLYWDFEREGSTISLSGVGAGDER